MAGRPSYARFVLTADRFPEFRAALKTAKFEALEEAAKLAEAAAKRLEAKHNKSGDTNASIWGQAFPHGFAVHVGTLQGVFLEYGTKPRYTKSGAYRGFMHADPYLHPAALLAARAVPTFQERHMRGIRAFVPARGNVRIVYQDTAGRFAGSAGGL